MRRNWLAPIVLALGVLCVLAYIATGAWGEAEAQTGYKLAVVFIAISCQSARLSCDGEAVTVQAHMSEAGGCSCALIP